MQISRWLLVFGLLTVALGAPEGQQLQFPQVQQVSKQQQLPESQLYEQPQSPPLPVQPTQRQKQKQMLANEEPMVRLQHALLHLLLLGREPLPEDMQEIKEEVLEQLKEAVEAQQLPKLQLDDPQMQRLRQMGHTLGQVLEDAAEAKKLKWQLQGGDTQQLQDPQMQDPQMQGPQTRIPLDITDTVEKIRDIIVNGDEGRGIPPLDPFNLTQVELLDLYEEDAWEVLADLSNLTVKGLAELDATLDADFRLTRLHLTLPVTVPQVAASGNYRFDALLGGEAVHLFGSGPFELTVSEFDFVVKVAFRYSIFPPKLTYESVDVDFGLESLTFSVTGLLEGGLLDDILSLGVSTLGVPVLELLKPNLKEAITDVLDPIISSSVEEINVLDILCSAFPIIPVIC